METRSPELTSWVTAEKAVAEPYLNAIPAREAIQKRLSELWNYEQYGYRRMGEKSRTRSSSAGDIFRREEREPEPGRAVSGVRARSPPKVLVDPNTVWPTRRLCSTTFDQSRWPLRRLRGFRWGHGLGHLACARSGIGRDPPDPIGDTNFTGVSWLPDASIFYYPRTRKRGREG